MQNCLTQQLKQSLSDGIRQVITDFTGEVYNYLTKSNSFQQSYPELGSIWISSVDVDNKYVLSAYYHPSKEHSASTIGKLDLKKSVASAGNWAISIQTKALFGNKAFYDSQK